MMKATTKKVFTIWQLESADESDLECLDVFILKLTSARGFFLD